MTNLWIDFEDAGTSGSGITRVWKVVNKEFGALLGTVRWYPGWRRYVFEPKAGTIFEQDCLRCIADFVVYQTVEHKQARKAAKHEQAHQGVGTAQGDSRPTAQEAAQVPRHPHRG